MWNDGRGKRKGCRRWVMGEREIDTGGRKGKRKGCRKEEGERMQEREEGERGGERVLEEGGRVGGTEAGGGRDVCGMMGVGRRRDA